MTRYGPLTARQRPSIASNSFNTIASPSLLPEPSVMRVLALAGDNADSQQLCLAAAGVPGSLRHEVRRHRDDDGRRLVRLQLTPAGARRRAALGAAHLEELRRPASLATAAAGLDAAAGAEPHRPLLAPLRVGEG